MAEEEAKKEKAGEEKPAPKSGGGKGLSIVAFALVPLAAGGAAFFATKFVGGHPPPKVVQVVVHEEPAPGPTLALEPFLISVNDLAKKPHAMKLTVAVEFKAPTGEAAGGGEHGGKGAGDETKKYVPRIRDAFLTYLRSLTYEDVADSKGTEKLRTELVEQLKKANVHEAERVLITDLVLQ